MRLEKKEHSPDMIADAVSRTVLGAHFRKIGRSRLTSVVKLLTTMFVNNGQKYNNTCIVTAVYGYGKESFQNLAFSFGLSTTLVMPDHIFHSHIFVAFSYLNSHQTEEELQPEDIATDEIMDAEDEGLVHEDADTPLTSVKFVGNR